MQAPTILVIDSGVGGLSIFRHLLPLFPPECLHYFADSAYAPYGDKSDEWVNQRVQAIVARHQPEQLLALVLASNTLTAAAASHLRARYPKLAIVGVEPGLKPALTATTTQRIGVLATQLTVQSHKFQTLLAHTKNQAPHVQWTVQACPGLVECIEAGQWDSVQMNQVLKRVCAPLLANQVDTVVLGCTHYPFIESYLRLLIGPKIQIIDTGPAVAAQVQRVVGKFNPSGLSTPARITSTGDPLVFAGLFERLIGGPARIQFANY